MTTLSSSSIRDNNYHKMKAQVGSNGVETISEQTRPLINVSPTRGTPPSDRFFVAFFIFCLLGVGHLLPWNFFITATLYFESKFSCPVGNSTSACSGFIKEDYENFFSIAAMLPGSIMTAFNIWLQSRVHYDYRMLISLIGTALVFSVTLAFVPIHTSTWVNVFFSLTLLMVMSMNVLSGIFQSSTLGFAGIFPSKYTTGVMCGQAVAGITASVAVLISLTASSTDPTISGVIYFSIALVFSLVCLVSFFVMRKLTFVQYYLTQTSVEVRKNRKAILERSTNVRLDASPPFISIFLKIFVYALSVFLVFAVTLSLFPSVISRIKSNSASESGWTGAYFSPLVCFLMFNSSDFVGRLITRWTTFPKNRFLILLLAVGRFSFIPLFLLCNAGQGADHRVPIIFNNDAYPVVFVFLFGLSNGYLGSLAMIVAPMSTPADQRETASTIMVFFLTFGLLCGSCVSFIWTKVVLAKS